MINERANSICITSRNNSIAFNNNNHNNNTRAKSKGSISLPFTENRIDYIARTTKDHEDEVKMFRRRFIWFSIIASTNHALNYVVTSYATSLLG